MRHFIVGGLGRYVILFSWLSIYWFYYKTICRRFRPYSYPSSPRYSTSIPQPLAGYISRRSFGCLSVWSKWRVVSMLTMYVQHAGLVIFGNTSYVTICLLVLIVLGKKTLLLGMV